MDAFAAYSHAIVAMAATAVMLLIMGPLSAMKKTKLGLAPGATPEADYGSRCYRWHRAFGNLSESIGPFVAVTLAAILAGANPFWVNLLASLFLVARLVLAVVHVNGIGKPDMSVRSYAYVAGLLMCLILAGMAIVAAICG
ncbi:MAG: MAPEG family protein [Roseovarius sp.]|nr:MAPEG family protein [Roseovarius sp.]